MFSINAFSLQFSRTVVLRYFKKSLSEKDKPQYFFATFSIQFGWDCAHSRKFFSNKVKSDINPSGIEIYDILASNSNCNTIFKAPFQMFIHV